jgi:Family of unknown function (DUF5947)
MAGTGATAATSRLRRLASRSHDAPAAEERCELCGEPIEAKHRHLLDLSNRELMCACRACSTLFDREAAGGGHFRLIPDRRSRIADFALTDADWAELRIPVDMAFFFHSSREERVMAFYPSPMGATESTLQLAAWEGIESANPILREMEPDVEALLVNRARGAREHWLVSIEECYRLVGLIRLHWKGLTGGQEVWQRIGEFFRDLGSGSRTVGREGATNETKAGTGTPAGGEEA